MEHAEPFWQSAEFWILVAFVIFVAIAAKPAWRAITTMLDERARTIRNDLKEAERLREEAQKMLAEAQRNQRDSVNHAKEIIETARSQTERLTREAGEQLEAALDRRMRHAHERIAQAEALALAEVRATAAEVAIETARHVIREHLPEERKRALIARAIEEVPARLG
ncbi:MAG: F0F1 ATP synthase subunit B [Proteobacteria bacterium]|nr:F0F1 ATP synthase subunit B [Pseudomonadota bacterium]